MEPIVKAHGLTKCKISRSKKGYQHMNTNTSVNNQSTASAREHYTTGSVTSQDGTTIGYRQFGHGPGAAALPRLRPQQADWLIDTVMSWTKSLVRRF